MTLPPTPNHPAVNVRVKPLEWSDRSRAWVYAVKSTYGQGSKPFMVTRGNVVIAWTDSQELGRAAAQADHEAEILSFLDLNADATADAKAAKRLYRKKTCVIDAMQWTGDNTRAVAEWAYPGVEPYGLPPGWWLKQPDDGSFRLVISTGERVHEVWPGDWIIKDGDEFRALKPWMFETTYEAAPLIETGVAPVSGPPDDPRLVRARELLQPFVGLSNGELIILKHMRDVVPDLMRALFDALDVQPAPPEGHTHD